MANFPANPKTSAKLLVYDRSNDSITHATIADLPTFLPSNSAIIFNNTKVIKARIFGAKSTGGKVELLFIKPANSGYLVQIRGNVNVGDRLLFQGDLIAIVKQKYETGERVVEFWAGDNQPNYTDLINIFQSIGHTPLPPYIKRNDNLDDVASYQSCFASRFGSVAAPTASLHFDEKLLQTIRSNHDWAEVTLHVGLGTFKGVETDDIRSHHMHSERYELSKKALDLVRSDKPIVAIGTTVCRTVEYFVRTNRSSGECDLFLHPNNKPQRINHLLTNFHLPRSTLLMLVAGFIGLEKTKEIYQIAITNNYRFFSYGDAMLIL